MGVVSSSCIAASSRQFAPHVAAFLSVLALASLAYDLSWAARF